MDTNWRYDLQKQVVQDKFLKEQSSENIANKRKDICIECSGSDNYVSTVTLSNNTKLVS